MYIYNYVSSIFKNMVKKLDFKYYKRKKYNELLCSTFKIPLNSTTLIPYNFKNDLFNIIDYDDNKKIIVNDFSINYGIYLKTEFIFYLDDLFIGIYDNKYVVSLMNLNFHLILLVIMNQTGWKILMVGQKVTL